MTSEIIPSAGRHLNAALLMAYEHRNGLTSFINVYDTELRLRSSTQKNAEFSYRAAVRFDCHAPGNGRLQPVALQFTAAASCAHSS